MIKWLHTILRVAVDHSAPIPQAKDTEIEPVPQETGKKPLKKSKQRPHKAFKKFKLEIEEVADEWEEGIIGRDTTFLALKDEGNYLLGTSRKGLKLIQNKKEVYSRKLPQSSRGPLRDLVYASVTDCYFLDLHNKLYRKDIDEEAPYLFMSVPCSGSGYGSSLRYSEPSGLLFVNKSRESILAVNLSFKEIIFELKKDQGGSIVDYNLLGGQTEHLLAWLTVDGFIGLCQLNLKQKTGGLVSKIKIDGAWESGAEEGKSLAVCEQGEFIFTNFVKKGEDMMTSRIVVLKVESGALKLKASLDYFSQAISIAPNPSLSTFGYKGSYVLILTLDRSSSGTVRTFCFESVGGTISELVGKGVDHGRELHPSRLHLLDNGFYYTGDYGTVKKLSITL